MGFVYPGGAPAKHAVQTFYDEHKLSNEELTADPLLTIQLPPKR
jgi:hypothetical protein